jgi:ribosomal protein L11 methyltransferase
MGGADPSTWAYALSDTSMEAVDQVLTVAGITPDGLSEEGGTTTAWFTDRPAGLQQLLPGGVWRRVVTADWVQEYKRGITPVTVGRITILPPWLAPDGPQVGGDAITLVIEPGMAFGTGHHESTTACLRVLQDLPLHGRHVVDVGTGTGVLALAARALGAASVSAVDIDPEAVAVARANLADHPLDRITVAAGSCAAAGSGDVVVANIITDNLLALADDLVALVRPGGTLVASGIAVDRIAEAAARFEQAGIATTPHPGREWALLVGHRTAGKASGPREIPGS